MKTGILFVIDAIWAYLAIHYWDVMRKYVKVNLDNTWQYFVVETWYLASILIFCIFILMTLRSISPSKARASTQGGE